MYKEQPNQPFPRDSGLDMAPRDVHRDVQRYIAKRPVAGGGAVRSTHMRAATRVARGQALVRLPPWTSVGAARRSAGAGPMPPTDCTKLRKARDDRGSKTKAGTFIQTLYRGDEKKGGWSVIAM